ncbi:MAG: rhomboid family intramembrane serine protease [Calditrichia bacterium]
MFPLKDTIPSKTFPVINYLLIALNVLIWFFETSLSQEQLQEFIHLFGAIPARFHWIAVLDIQTMIAKYYPLFTSMFLHGSWFHLLGNMWFLWIFGDNVEDAMGHVRYLIFYMLCGIIAGLTHIHLNPESIVPTVGASGAIAGVMGAYVLLYPRAKIITLIFIFIFIDIVELPAFFYLGLWIFMQFIQGTVSFLLPPDVGGVAWWAHIGGFLGGFLLVYLFKKPQHKRVIIYPDEFYPW